MKKTFNLQYYTPKADRKIALFIGWGGFDENGKRNAEWMDIYPGEVLLAHKSHESYLIGSGLVPTNRGATVYRTQREALKGSKDNFRLPFRE